MTTEISTTVTRRSFPGGDGRDFTEAEYIRELTQHRIKVENGQSAAAVYRQNYAAIFNRPRTGIFKDFFLYGVHPAQVSVLSFTLTIPFLVSSLTAKQLAAEITNQRARTEKKKPDTKWPEEEQATKSSVIISPQGTLQNSPTPDAAYELVELLRKRKKFIPYTPPLRRLLSALELYNFVYGGFDKVKPQFFIPQRDDLVMLLPLIMLNKSAAQSEIHEKQQREPSQWGLSDPSKASLSQIAELLVSVMSTAIYTSNLRKVVDWFKKDFMRMKIYKLIDNILIHKNDMISVVTLVRPLSEVRLKRL